MEVFFQWFQEANEKEGSTPNAMTLSTVDGLGQPWSRIVLLKDFEGGLFRFFTSVESTKGRQLAENPKVCLHFHWKSLFRQVQILGDCVPLPQKEAAAYFQTRPRESQISSWVSPQSSAVGSRSELLQRRQQFLESLDADEKSSKEKPLPVPSHWGGYGVKPHHIEFWQGAAHRLHHRVLFEQSNDQPLGSFGPGKILAP